MSRAGRFIRLRIALRNGILDFGDTDVSFIAWTA